MRYTPSKEQENIEPIEENSEEVLEEVKANDKSTQILLDYNKIINEDERVETVLLPIRDGLTVTRVK